MQTRNFPLQMNLFIPAIKTERDLSKYAKQRILLRRKSQKTTAYFLAVLTFLYMAQKAGVLIGISVMTDMESYWLQNEF
ncbi:hypothetical protein [Atlantibacter hermannii]|uniref:hypothetical protein n=1 Tax=Atlantibacter hermannii TaxID=565 RepID=UPI0028A10C5E|nr:hypothetical protein [Atlantibacter hermannii]